ncbi:MAG: ABC transporter permease [Thermomicrobiales bacterium]
MRSLSKMILIRCGLGFATLVVVAVIIFLGVSFQPGDAAQALLGRDATPEALAALRLELGLNQPLHVRFFSWLNNVLHGNFGVSYANRRDVIELIVPRLRNTLFLAGIAAVIAIPLSLALGIASALYRNTVMDRTTSIISLWCISFPEYFIGYILILILSLKFNLFPSLAQITPATEFLPRLYQSFLPALTLSLAMSAHIIRLTRAAILNVIASPYIEMARLKGLSPVRTVVKHALPNALGPIINVVILNLAYLLVGVVIVEVVFVYPGLGQLFVDAVSKRDFPIVQAVTLLFAATYVVLNLIADVLSILTNPRLLHAR